MVGVVGLILRGSVCSILLSLPACSEAPPESTATPPNPTPAIEQLTHEEAGADDLSASLPAYRDPVVQEWSLYNSRCRDASFDEVACRKRDALSIQVEARGWCYERGPKGGTDWISCSESGRYEEASLNGEDAQPQDPPSDDNWYLVGVRTGECALVSAVIGVSTPEEVAALYSSQGRPLRLATRNEVFALLQEAGNPGDPGMALALGRSNCDLALARLGR
jgi:hypothetical protein